MNDLSQGLYDLPFDILTLIPSYLSSIRDVLSFSLVCKIWNDAVLHSDINIPVTINNEILSLELESNTHNFKSRFNWSQDELKKIVQQIKQKPALKIINLQVFLHF